LDPKVWSLLAREAWADALRRRVVPVIAVLALVSLFTVDSCTSCSPVITQNGQEVALPQVAGAGGLLVMVLLGLWTMVLAGVLGSDHLAEPLADGSASLLLARPVSRHAFGLARLVGAWGLAAATGVVLLFVTAWLLQARQGLPPAPALPAAAACLCGAWTVAALAMTVSLWLPRTLTALGVFAAVWLIAALELSAQFGAQLTGVAGLIERLGPPLAAPMIVALGSWIEPAASVRGSALALGARSLAWALASTGFLTLAFRRIELGR
jgi:ABC-type transport system involved in multi-copper enzyme maturation permease subunit